MTGRCLARLSHNGFELHNKRNNCDKWRADTNEYRPNKRDIANSTVRPTTLLDENSQSPRKGRYILLETSTKISVLERHESESWNVFVLRSRSENGEVRLFCALIKMIWIICYRCGRYLLDAIVCECNQTYCENCIEKHRGQSCQLQLSNATENTSATNQSGSQKKNANSQADLFSL